MRPRTLGRDLESSGFKAGFAIFVHVCNSGTRRLKSLFFVLDLDWPSFLRMLSFLVEQCGSILTRGKE